MTTPINSFAGLPDDVLELIVSYTLQDFRYPHYCSWLNTAISLSQVNRQVHDLMKENVERQQLTLLMEERARTNFNIQNALLRIESELSSCCLSRLRQIIFPNANMKREKSHIEASRDRIRYLEDRITILKEKQVKPLPIADLVYITKFNEE